MNIELQLYGACRDLHPQPRLTLHLPQGARVADLRQALPGLLAGNDPARVASLIASSAFASDSELLRDGDRLPADGRVAILPPVSGG